jgi:hypothetical protein
MILSATPCKDSGIQAMFVTCFIFLTWRLGKGTNNIYLKDDISNAWESVRRRFYSDTEVAEIE